MRESRLKRIILETMMPLNIIQYALMKEHTDESIKTLKEKIDEILQKQGKAPQRDASGRFISTKGENGTTEAQASQPQKVVSPYTDEKGKKWVHVCAGDLDFLLDIQDLTEKEVNWEEAKKLAADAGMRLNPKREFQLIGAFQDEINKCCKELGGKPLEGWYWTGDECYGNYAWVYYAMYGKLGYYSKMDSNGVRGSLAFKKS